MNYSIDFSEIKNEQAVTGLGEFIGEFLVDRVKENEELDVCLETRDFFIMKSIGHKWKGYSAPYGFHKLGVLGEALEEAALSQNLESCQQIKMNIDEYLKLKKEILTKH